MVSFDSAVPAGWSAQDANALFSVLPSLLSPLSLQRKVLMSESSPQSATNHTRWLPAYHYFTVPVLLVYFCYTLWVLTQNFSWPTVLAALVALALFLLSWVARVMPLAAQDRVIRLEERLRMARLFPADLQGRIEELSTRQLVALRFASDGELVDLTRKVLEQGITDQKVIKGMITAWRPDDQRV